MPGSQVFKSEGPFNSSIVPNQEKNAWKFLYQNFSKTNYFFCRFWPFQSFNKIPESSPSLINWKTIETKLPWGVIILLGGGFAVSDACTKSGLSAWIVQKMMILVGLPPLAICIIVVLSTVALTQVHVIKTRYIY